MYSVNRQFISRCIFEDVPVDVEILTGWVVELQPFPYFVLALRVRKYLVNDNLGEYPGRQCKKNNRSKETQGENFMSHVIPFKDNPHGGSRYRCLSRCGQL